MQCLPWGIPLALRSAVRSVRSNNPRPDPPPSTFLRFGFPFRQFRSHFSHEAKGFLLCAGERTTISGQR